eukprot:2081475-Lingulodinium_polyedra.AAC.1
MSPIAIPSTTTPTWMGPRGPCHVLKLSSAPAGRCHGTQQFGGVGSAGATAVAMDPAFLLRPAGMVPNDPTESECFGGSAD